MVKSSRLRTGSYGFLLFIIVIAIILTGVLPHPRQEDIPDTRLAAWLGVMALLIAFIVVAGKFITGYWRGALIDDRNQISLSRLQLALWTGLILSAYLEAALSNIRLAQAESPLTIGMPAEIWAVLGIATTSLVGSPLILATKRDRVPDPLDAKNTLNQLGNAGVPAIAEGQVIKYRSPADASWSDMLTGDETANGTHLDLGKVQMFFFTFVLVVAYAVALGSLFLHTDGKIGSLPALDAGMIALLGISHAGYLANKAIPRSDPSRQVVLPPTVARISPPSGAAAGGYDIVVTGSGFTGATEVKLGQTPAPNFAVDSDGQITVPDLPGGAGAVDLTVTTPRWTSAITPGARFTYT
jgi:IPT/TIG domain